jgi:ubiquinone/menaquinone biosynthesis C-methylase UbiE
MREEWSKNFADYMQPHTPESFAGRLVLDVGTGSGRHAYHAAQLGADVVAVDLGRSIDVARANLPAEVLTVQADAEQLPLARGAFDFVMSIGVLHHLPDPEAGLRAIVPFAKPGGTVHVYLYWMPEINWQSKVLRGVAWARQYTVRLPHRVLHALCYRRRPRLARLAAGMPLKTYADYPFGVLVNDQFDRLSAPLECRYTRAEVADLLERVGLTDVRVLPNFGWLGDGQTAAAP